MIDAMCFRAGPRPGGSSCPLARTPAFLRTPPPPRSFVSDFGNSAIVRIGNFGLGNTTIFTNYWIAQPSGMWLAPNGNLIVADFDRFSIISLAFTGDTAVVTQLFQINPPPAVERPTDVGGTPWLSLFITQKDLAVGLRLMPSTAIGSMWSNVQGVWVDC